MSVAASGPGPGKSALCREETPPKRHRIIESPLGAFVVFQGRRGSLCAAWFHEGDDPPAGVRDDTWQGELSELLSRYFSGEDVDFSPVPTPAGSPFHTACWNACRAIPRGETRSYAQLAAEAGSSSDAARAAGQAMRRNPLPVIIPCHRVVSATGELHGYSGSRDPTGIDLRTKSRLLKLESAPADPLLWE